MVETRVVFSKCETCETTNDIPLSYFLPFDCKVENAVIATCKSCNCDFVVTLKDSLI